MSDFIVDVREIQSIYPHDNADRLELGKVAGLDFQFVMQKDCYEVGDKVVYFPVDSLMTSELMELFELTFLAGSNKNRVRTIKLRGKVSQGLVLPLEKFWEAKLLTDVDVGDDVTERLGIFKWEPAPVMSGSGNLCPLPDGISHYDIQGYERYPEATARLMELEVMITEKMEGTNISVTVYADEDKEVCVNQRNFTIHELRGDEYVQKNLYWETARNTHAIKFAKCCLNRFGGEQLTLYGELCGPGVQKNLYKLDKHMFFMYDIKVDGRFLSVYEFMSLLENACNDILDNSGLDVTEHGLVPVYIINDSPIILRDWLDGRTIEEASTGPSASDPDMLREGIVIKPLEEEYSEDLQGRLILKKRSPEYLAKYGM